MSGNVTVHELLCLFILMLGDLITDFIETLKDHFFNSLTLLHLFSILVRTKDQLMLMI